MSSPTLSIDRLDAHHVQVGRSEDVSDVLWGKVCAEWGTRGDNPGQMIVTPNRTFLAHLQWLPEACKRFQTGLVWSDEAKRFVAGAIDQVKAISAIQSGIVSLSDEQVQARLSRTRFARELRPFQVRDAGRLLALRNGANFSVPGAGKTTVTYAVYEAERHTERVSRLLVVAPLSAFDAWMSEAEVCFTESPVVYRYDGRNIPSNAEVVLVNYQRLPDQVDSLAQWVQSAPTHLVLDEAHRIKKGWEGAWGRSALELAFLPARRDILTGTPAPQSLKDVVALIDFLWPTQARRILPRDIFSSSPQPQLAVSVSEAIAPLFVRTTKADLNLPEPQYRVREVPLTGLQRDIYFALRNQYAGDPALARTDRVGLARLGKIVMYLLQAATNPALLPIGGDTPATSILPRFPSVPVPAEADLLSLISRYPEHEVSPKLAALMQLLDTNAKAGRKTLVWTNFIANIRVLMKLLSGLKPARVYGAIPSEVTQASADLTREAELKRFREDSDCLVLIANPGAMSEGVSLHRTCHDAVYLDRTFNAGHYLQSVDRIHRLGMDEHDTNITFLVTQETIDVTANQRIAAKAETMGGILNDPSILQMALPDEDDVESQQLIDQDDLVVIAEHLRGDDQCGSPSQHWGQE